MSDLLLHWLNHDLHLSTYVTDVEADFASGYLLGELLHRLNHQHNFSDFMNSPIADAKILNFCLLEPSLRHLNIKFDSKVATAIMNGKRDAAANVLYQIKMAAERIRRAPGVSTRSLERTNIHPLHNMPVKLAKPTYDAAKHYFFEHSVRRQVKSLATLKQERDAIEEEQRVQREYRAEQARIQAELKVTKAERLHRAFIHSHFIKTALEETDSPAWRLALEKKHTREQRKAHFYKQLAAHRAQKQEEHTFSLRHSTQRDLDEFERRESSPRAANGSLPARKSVGYGLRSLSATLEQSKPTDNGLGDPHKPNPVGETPELQSNNSVIKEQKQRREKRREHLDRRRKRFLLDSQQTQGQRNQRQALERMETVVARATPREDEAQGEMSKILVYKTIAKENRDLREATYAHRRETDQYEAIDTDASRFELLFAKYNDDWELLVLQQTQREIARQSARAHGNQLLVGIIMQEFIDFALFIAARREDTSHARGSDIFLHDTTWQEYKHQFVRGRLIDPPDESKSAENQLVHHQLIEYLNSFLAPQFTGDYVGAVAKGSNMRSPWVPTDWKFVGACEILEDRFVLGETVKYVRWLAVHYTPPSVVEPAEVEAIETPSEEQSALHKMEPREEGGTAETLPSENQEEPLQPTEEETTPALVPPLRILLVGPPFAGKKTQAQKLAETYELVLISVEERLTQAVDTATSLGIEAQGILSKGEELPPRIYSQLIVEAVSTLLQPRWVVYDLPATKEHAVSLEEALTGFVEPSLIPSPYDHVSILAPGCAAPPLSKTFLHGKSGLDLVFYLNSVDATLLERCLGQLRDPATDTTFHLLTDPPSVDSTDRYRLVHDNVTRYASELLSLQCLSVHDASKDQKTWFQRFDVLRDVTTTQATQGQALAITWPLTVEDVEKQLHEHISAFFQARDDEKIANQASKEAQEATWMLEEETRQIRLHEMEAVITRAQDEVLKAQQVVQQAEEAKAKKDELAELRGHIETAKKGVDVALASARDWLLDEQQRIVNSRTTYSGGLIPPLGSVLAQLWNHMEDEYSHAMKTFFAEQKQQRERVTDHAMSMVESFCKMLRRPDRKQSVLNAFQAQFNAVLEPLRFDDTTKQELHARTDLLQDELCSITMHKHQENDEEVTAMMSDLWLEDTCQYVAVLHQSALQAECDRFRVTLQLLLDGFSAASDDPAQLQCVVDVLKAQPQAVELSVKAFLIAIASDKAPEPAPTPAPAAATGKAAAGAKGAKGKPPLNPVASVSSMEQASSADPLAVDELLLVYDQILQRCEAVAQLILNAPSKNDTPEPPPPTPAPPPTKAGKGAHATPAATPSATPVSSAAKIPRQTIDVATSNFMKAIRYESELMQRRVRALKESALTACEEVTRAIRLVESTLRDANDERKLREEAAIAAVVQYIRHTIEAEHELPYYIDIQPEQVYRFPSTLQLREDTCATVNPRDRLVPRAAVDPPPEIEPRHDFLVNDRQVLRLRTRFFQACFGQEPMHLSLCQTLEVLVPLTTLPDALPRMWRHCPEETLVKICTAFLDESSHLIRIDALLDALIRQDNWLRGFLSA
ncbi:hypothetical protein Poli38472_000665 [Pythium oligandrum]|uniref:Calponin-homology (CH) domain-containing protein n=1 Tax=Pythium oligandrum TaxID=41045 RepID=A0A8K1CDJ2_PYTOL|nr:hypothetical protein Poli38472_000665 [Pythium oligandrum]|eukprot:TMW60623.1 hypothetical protein Poli38472_000665 [Pythium oligandrum]